MRLPSFGLFLRKNRHPEDPFRALPLTSVVGAAVFRLG